MVRIHPTAEVSPLATIGEDTQIWHHAQVREHASVGRQCILGKGVYVDVGVRIGDRCKLQNGAFIYHGVTLEDGVFVGPGAILTNDRLPRAINPDGTLKRDADWEVGTIHVGYGASLGAGCIVLPDLSIGAFAMVAAGAVVTRDVPDYGLVMGIPARLVGFVCRCGRRLRLVRSDATGGVYYCEACDATYHLPRALPGAPEEGEAD
ncbi:MAG: N-acetyltransferase [Caldilineales bacterium]|nr:N-acetyltransferase [Caldilineales bacterium]MDW8316778.1 acyltransferase [Anaerolineae bacterium]